MLVIRVAVGAILLALVPGCAGGGPQGEPGAASSEALRDGLVKKSRNHDPYWPVPVSERSVLSDGDAAVLQEYVVRHPEASAYHCLLTLREQRPQAYAAIPPAVKASVYAAALANLRFLNDWGRLHPENSYDSDLAKEFVALGNAGLPALSPLLSNRQAAPLSEVGGSENSTNSSRYKYRVCDFAYRYACLILGSPYVFQRTPEERDAAIAALQRKLADK
jgi:hypothetical protein